MRVVPRVPEIPRLDWSSRSRTFRLGLLVPTAFVCVSGGAVLAVMSVWPTAQVGLDSRALAFVKLAPAGERVGRVAVLDRSGRMVRVSTRDGVVMPLGKLQAGARFTVDVTVRRSSWVGWLVGGTEHVRAVVRTPAARVTTPLLYPEPDTPVKVSFSSPVSVVTVGSADERRRITLAKPRRTVSIGVTATGSTRSGGTLVSGVARPWERVPPPVRVNWFEAGPTPVVLVRPTPKSALAPSQPIVLTFSRPISELLGKERPRLVPRTPGTWHEPNDHTLVFQPNGLGFRLGAHVRLVLPQPIRVTTGAADPSLFRTVSWQVPNGSRLRLRQLLAQLGYLPLTWQPARDDVPLTKPAQALAAVQPPTGTFEWRYPKTPARMKSLWTSSERAVLVRGALMAFESAHDLPTDGLPDAVVWRALLRDEVARKTAGSGYTYVHVTETLPQTLTLWHNGRVVLRTPVNTGIPGRPTALGTYPVYIHVASTTMSGTNPDGSHYSDPGVPWVSYFNGGDALHGFARPGYGYPQSLGCVEEPFDAAEQIWPYTPVGTLVTVDA